MSKAPEMKPIRQVPTWDSSAEFTVTGSELESLYNFFNIFSPAITAVQQVFARGIQEEKVKIHYEYEDGTNVSETEVAEYTQKLQEYFANKNKEKEPFSEPLEGEAVAEVEKPTLSIV